MTDIVEQQLSEHEARRLTERIRLTAHNYTEAKEKLIRYVQEAKDGNAHVALGYASWQAYLAETLGEEPMILARDERQEMVKVLSAEGMSTRAIAPIVGVTHKTVVKDRQAERELVPEVPVDTPRISHGMDGKTRVHQPQPQEPQEPQKPRRRPIIGQARTVGWEVRKSVERIERILEDDRFNRNKEEVATQLRGHLQYAIEALTTALEEIN